MSKLLKLLKENLQVVMKQEIQMRKATNPDANIYKNAVATKTVVRAIISMFPEIGVKPDKATDDDTLKLLKKYVFIEKTRELYIQKYLTEGKIKDLSSKGLNNLTKETITKLGKELTSNKIKIAEYFLPREPSEEEITEWIDKNIDFSEYKNSMQAMGKIMQHFKGVDGNKVKRIIIDV